MAVGRKIAVLLVGILAIAATVNADMMPVSGVDIAYPKSAIAGSQPDLPSRSLSTLFGDADLADLSSPPIIFLGEVESQAETTHVTPLIWRDEQNSLGLCLFALLGLGLGKSAPCVRKFSFGTIPEWYHTGGPFQVGHSHAISPDCLYQAPVYCLFQPESPTEYPMPQCGQDGIMAVWRQHQFIPSVDAPRGPPFPSC